QKACQSLTPEQQKQTQIYADNYGEAGAIHHFGKQYNLPEVISLNSSFTLWAPDSLNAKYIIYVDNSHGKNLKRLGPHIESYRKIAEVDDSLAVEKGTAIYIFVHPDSSLNQVYIKELTEKRLSDESG